MAITEKASMIEQSIAGDLLGRRKIFTSKKEINPSNIVEVLSKAYAVHVQNMREIQYLYDVDRGKQDIRLKHSITRPEINNIVLVNRANEIKTFKTAYLLEQPIRYVSNGGDDSVSEQVAKLNKYMDSEDKNSKDKELIDWMHICGVGVRLVLPDPSDDPDASPVSLYTLDPRESFVIYYSGIGKNPVAGVVLQENEQEEMVMCVYTKDTYYEITNNEITFIEPHSLGRIPIIEYPNNMARIGAFEIVLPLLNAINTLESNRVDNVQDFVNAFDVFQNCGISGEEYSELTKGGKAIQVNSTNVGAEAKVYRVYSELNQTGVQTAIDDLYESVLTICGMPNRNGGSSTSDTGLASQLRDGWEAAESRASDTEKCFIAPEREATRLILKICNETSDLNLKLDDIKIEFTRKNLSNLQSKVQVLMQLLGSEYVHPKDAYSVSRVFPDGDAAYINGMKWHEEQQQILESELMEGMSYAATESVQDGGQSDQTPEQTSNSEIQ